jgi:hypothetical protein
MFYAEFTGISSTGGAAASPTYPGQILCITYTYDRQGAIEGQATIRFAMIEGPDIDGQSHNVTFVEKTSDDNGYLAVPLTAGAVYEANRYADTATRIEIPAEEPDEGYYTLPEIL